MCIICFVIYELYCIGFQRGFCTMFANFRKTPTPKLCLISFNYLQITSYNNKRIEVLCS